MNHFPWVSSVYYNLDITVMHGIEQTFLRQVKAHRLIVPYKLGTGENKMLTELELSMPFHCSNTIYNVELAITAKI